MLNNLFDRDENRQKLLQLVSDYKTRVASNNNKEEVYKWQLIKKFQETWNIDSPDFAVMLKRIVFKNLIFYNARKVIVDVATAYPEETRNSFRLLFNEQLPLQERIFEFQQTIRDLYNNLGFSNLATHQDERTIATYLTFNFPDNYTFYKATFFDKLAILLNFKKEAVGKIYLQYLGFIQSFIRDFILPDAELLHLKHGFLDDTCYPDENNIVLAQDILYQTLDKSTGRSYWKIGSKAGGNGASIWPEMKKNGIVSIGWSDLGDLGIRGILKKTDLAVELISRKYYDNKGVASRKAGEILDFYQQIKIDDIVSVCDGERVLAFARITGDYEFDNQLSFSHLRSVEWLAEPKNFKILDGPHTSVYKIKNPLTISSIEKVLSDSLPKGELLSKSLAKPVNFEVKNIILYGPPGTGKTFITTDYALGILEGQNLEKYKDEDRAVLQKRFNAFIKEGRAEFITFHQSYGYEDFVIGIKPKLEGDTMAFKRHEGVFYKICQRARENYLKSISQQDRIHVPFEEVFEEVLKDLDENNPVVVPNIKEGYTFKITKRNEVNLDFEKHSGGTGHKLPITTLKDVYEGTRSFSTNGIGTYIHPFVNLLKTKAETITNSIQSEPLQNYVLVIDEINRANISRVLGELITLLEPDKRLGGIQELEIKLSNGESFSVPPNLYLIGTMNTADKSIALLDIALRRRFIFKELLPDSNKIKDPAHKSFFLALNERVFKQKGKDFLIGHSYFMSNEEATVDLVSVMNLKVLPLLAEYFYKKEDEMVRLVKDAIQNSELRQQYVANADSNGFNKLVFELATKQPVDGNSN